MNNNNLLKCSSPAAGCHIVAVSGGVDSVVLLDLLHQSVKASSSTAAGHHRYVVAHVDHGIRKDSAANARFVEGLAVKYGMQFELLTLKLGPAAGEEAGRKARYDFFEVLRDKYQAETVVTAHHADDVLETMVLNLIRGTGWRGLASLRSTGTRLRPLLHVQKTQLVEYALANRLEWYEDSTNAENHYLRNQIRHFTLPAAVRADERFKDKMLAAYHHQLRLRAEIEELAAEIYRTIQQDEGIERLAVCAVPPEIQAELLRLLYARSGVAQTRPQLSRAAAFIASATNRQRFSLNKRRFLEVKAGNLVVSYRKN